MRWLQLACWRGHRRKGPGGAPETGGVHRPSAPGQGAARPLVGRPGSDRAEAGLERWHHRLAHHLPLLPIPPDLPSLGALPDNHPVGVPSQRWDPRFRAKRSAATWPPWASLRSSRLAQGLPCLVPHARSASVSSGHALSIRLRPPRVVVPEAAVGRRPSLGPPRRRAYARLNCRM